MRYKRQKDHFRCGPTAIHNARLFLGFKPSWAKDQHYYDKFLDTDLPKEHWGMYWRDLIHVLKVYSRGRCSATKIWPKDFSFEDIKPTKTECYILCGKYIEKDGESYGHFFMVDGCTKKGLWCVNLKWGGPTRAWYSFAYLKKVFKQKDQRAALKITLKPPKKTVDKQVSKRIK